MRKYFLDLFRRREVGAPKPQTQNKELLSAKLEAEKKEKELESKLIAEGYTKEQLEKLLFDKTSYITNNPNVRDFFLAHQISWENSYFEASNNQSVDELISVADKKDVGIAEEKVNPNELESAASEKFYGKIRAYVQHGKKKILFFILDPQNIHPELSRQFTLFENH